MPYFATRRGLRPARRRRTAAVFTAVLAMLAAGACSAPQQDEQSSAAKRTVTDVLGRKVDIPVPAKRILLDGARVLYTTALLNKQDPLQGIVGLPNDLEQNDPDSLQQYRKKFPGIDRIQRTGQVYDGSFSIEAAIRLHPDVFVLSAANYQAAQDAGIVDRLARVGVPTVVLDYFQDPIKNTAASVRLMGTILGRTAEADAFASYYQAAIDRVRSTLAAAHEPPTPTFLWRAPGYFECCSSFAKSNLAKVVQFAGGANLADDVLKTPQGAISPETILSRNPDVIIATGADWAPGTPASPGTFVPLGYRENAAAAAAQLKSIVQKQAGFPQLKAVREHRTYAAWHHFYDSPYNFLAVEWFAKWLHPELFRDVDPDATIRELHTKFLPIPYQGTFWTELR
ncbi:ABC transporter substrate-binding protein [Amycolatopsis ultiminotia]|uniref:ABC transporter substrate-binding protein n=1 Tax=Amycolatopsis ultiminotia TaxID=543629 RepID=A0ABP6WAB9_9PSEU